MDLHGLIKQALKNDRTAQNGLFRHLYAPMYRAAYMYLREEDSAKEAVQLSMIKVFNNLMNLRGEEARIMAWSRRITVNVCIDMLRKNIRLAEIEIDEMTEPGAEMFDFNADHFTEIIKEVEKLPMTGRLVLKLHVMEGLNHREISDILGISEQASRQALYEARVKLKKNTKKLMES